MHTTSRRRRYKERDEAEPRTQLAVDPIHAFGRNSISRPWSPTAMIKRHGRLSGRLSGTMATLCAEKTGRSIGNVPFHQRYIRILRQCSLGALMCIAIMGNGKHLAYEPCHHIQSDGIHSWAFDPDITHARSCIKFEGHEAIHKASDFFTGRNTAMSVSAGEEIPRPAFQDFNGDS
ncbi:hypothetical protein IW261DRAFT_32928 [Armillaria novae-zelandiae]|uniref:Uncharacterized protein n=1 Tax=Armillaria novae-zelandiae TaxID=153914 RepID=A0AA39USA2_9AGAR|nr:hypothetical protein IW261DRAFT_32928 [Armillaria novae-zelandiae]